MVSATEFVNTLSVTVNEVEGYFRLLLHNLFFFLSINSCYLQICGASEYFSGISSSFLHETKRHLVAKSESDAVHKNEPSFR